MIFIETQEEAREQVGIDKQCVNLATKVQIFVHCEEELRHELKALVNALDEHGEAYEMLLDVLEENEKEKGGE